MRPHSKSGFTLTELLVVLGLMGLVLMMALPSVTSFFKVSLNSATRELAGVINETYSATVVTGKIHRVAFDLAKSQYWAETGPNTVVLETKASLEREERRNKFRNREEVEKEAGERAAQFNLERSITRKKMTLPRGVKFEDVLTEISKDPVTEGIAYAHFFPHGLTEQTIIHLKDESSHQSSLIISPLLGKTRLIDRYVKEVDAEAY